MGKLSGKPVTPLYLKSSSSRCPNNVIHYSQDETLFIFSDVRLYLYRGRRRRQDDATQREISSIQSPPFDKFRHFGIGNATRKICQGIAGSVRGEG